MRVALVATEVKADPATNAARAVEAVRVAAQEGAEIIVFPEAALTGLINTGNPRRDLSFGQAVPGPYTMRLGEAARNHSVHVAFGLFERVQDRLYDSAVLLDERGEVALHYRRKHPGWRTRGCGEDVYALGENLAAADTRLGRFAFLLCGDLFDDGITTALRAERPDWLLVLMWRALPDGHVETDAWEESEEPSYAARVALAGIPTLMVNAYARHEVSGGACGGAWLRRADGSVIAKSPVGRPGVLIADVEP